MYITLSAKNVFRPTFFNTLWGVLLKIRKLNCLYFKNGTRYQRNSNGFEFRGVLAMHCKIDKVCLLNKRTLLKKTKIEKMPYFSNKKRYRKNSRSREEQLVNFSWKSETKNSVRRWWVLKGLCHEKSCLAGALGRRNTLTIDRTGVLHFFPGPQLNYFSRDTIPLTFCIRKSLNFLYYYFFFNSVWKGRGCGKGSMKMYKYGWPTVHFGIFTSAIKN